MTARFQDVRAWLDGQDADAFLISSPVNVGYVSGFASSSAALLIQADSTHLFTDARYAEASKAVEGAEPVILERNLFAELGAVLDDYTAGPVAFESTRLSVAAHAQLDEKSGAELVPAANVLERIRARKDAVELAAVKRAADVLSRALERVPEMEPRGRSERELAWMLERLMREDLGAESLSFPAIVASGPNAARPHHVPGDRTISADEILLIDTGCVVDGYCSDCTRVYATGSLPDELINAYHVCREIQEAALEDVVVGAEIAGLDQTHRVQLAAHGYSVDHSLGHGVGLEIHEEPRLARTSFGVLETGNVVTVEPGIYLPDVGGVRIEDMVIVEGSGASVITPVTKDLVAV